MLAMLLRTIARMILDDDDDKANIYDSKDIQEPHKT